MNWRAGFLALATLVGALTAALPDRAVSAPRQVAPTVRVGAWNIEHLGNPGSRGGGNKDVAQEPADLADYITAAKVDVLALSEVSDDDGQDDTRTNKSLDKAFAAVKEKTGQAWKHVLFPKPDGSKSQSIGVAWNTAKASQVGDTLKIGVPNSAQGASIWNRHPHAVKFSLGADKTDVVLIPVHMKANTGGSPPPKKKRELEAKTLMQELGKIQDATSDFDIVILGDTNILATNEKAGQVFKTFGFRDLNAEDEATYITGAPFDRFYVPDDQPEFVGMGQEVFDTEYLDAKNLTRAEFRKRFSDHFMVVTRVRILPDDDE